LNAIIATDEPTSSARPSVANGPWRLHPRVAVRPEPFGALAYHYDNRRLNFLRSPELVSLVEQLGDHPSARHAFDAIGIHPQRWSAFERALASLAESDFIQPAPSPDRTEPT
jgi:putative mycofactocin binding protein MftB